MLLQAACKVSQSLDESHLPLPSLFFFPISPHSWVFMFIDENSFMLIKVYLIFFLLL